MDQKIRTDGSLRNTLTIYTHYIPENGGDGLALMPALIFSIEVFNLVLYIRGALFSQHHTQIFLSNAIDVISSEIILMAHSLTVFTLSVVSAFSMCLFSTKF